MNEEQQKLVEEHISLAQKVATIFSGEPEGNRFDDALSDAYLGLCVAAENYVPRESADFRTYAWIKINGYILNGLESRGEELQLDEKTEEAIAVASLEGCHESITGMPTLTTNECEAIKSVVMGDMTQEEYAESAGVTQARVCQLIETAKAKLQRLGKERLTEMLI